MMLSLAVLSLAAASGCANSDAGSRVAAKATVPGPEQVVRRIEPAPVEPVSAAPPGAQPASGAAIAPPPEADRAPSESPGNAEPITSKHLEAELNRLEAELR